MFKTTLFRALNIADQIIVNNVNMELFYGGMELANEPFIMLQLSDETKHVAYDQEIEINSDGKTVVKLSDPVNQDEKYNAEIEFVVIIERPLLAGDLIPNLDKDN